MFKQLNQCLCSSNNNVTLIAMTKTELKEKLIETLAKTEDRQLLEDIYRIVNMETDPKEIYQLSEPEMNAVNEGLEQLNKGQFISNEDLNTKFDKWLEE